MIRIFDSHIHMDTRNCSDYELMALAGVAEVLVPCSPTRERKFSPESWAERFDKLITFECVRAKSFGVALHVALAVNGADIGSHASAILGIDAVAERLEHGRARAIGELAFRTFSPAEIDVFQRQLQLAAERRCPVIIEAPIEPADFERALRLLEGALSKGWVEPLQVCLVDLNHAKLRRARELRLGGYGLPVSPRMDAPFCIREKLDHREVIQVLEELGPEGVMLNSGLHAGNADPLCLARTVLRLGLQGVSTGTLQAIAHDNAQAFFLGSPGAVIPC